MRKAVMYEGDDHIDDHRIHLIARVCAACTNQYDPAGACSGCKYNCVHYTGGDVQRAMLFYNEADIGHRREKKAQALNDMSDWIKVILGFALLIFMVGFLVVNNIH